MIYDNLLLYPYKDLTAPLTAVRASSIFPPLSSPPIDGVLQVQLGPGSLGR
jgi:hypothetical protein